MKKEIRILIFLISTVHYCLAQPDLEPVLKQLKLNVAIPDLPAFNILNNQAQNSLLRPSTPQAITSAFSSFYSNGKIIFPENIALELSPSLLLNVNKPLSELNEYSKNRLLNTLRISVGTLNKSDELTIKSRSIGLGFRINLLDKADPATDLLFHQKISDALKDFRKETREIFLIQFAIKNNIDINQLDFEFLIMGNPALKKRFDLELANENSIPQKRFLAILKKIKDDYKTANWNADKIDLASAISFKSSDSLAKNAKLSTSELWFSAAKRCGKNGLLTFGLNGRLENQNLVENNNKLNYQITLPIRYYIGTNRVKAFADAHYQYKKNTKSGLFAAFGSELNLYDGFWLMISTGFEYNKKLNNATLQTSFDLKIMLPENFNF